VRVLLRRHASHLLSLRHLLLSLRHLHLDQVHLLRDGRLLRCLW
jgi:hypothetical protein